MQYRSVIKDVGQGKVQPLYVLYGTEMFLMEEFIHFLRDKVLDPSLLDFNYSVYDLNEAPLQQVVEDAETLPFMGEKRMVVAKNALFFTGAKPGGVEHDLDALQRYLQNPPDTSVLVLTVPQEKLDERKKIVKMIKDRQALVPFMPLRDQELRAWIERRAQKRNVRMDAQAAQLLGRMVGNDLRRLQQEMDKLSSYVGEGGVITEQAVYELASRTLEQDIFGLVDCVARLELEQALRIYYDLLKNKEEPLAILMLLARQFRLILQVKVLAAKGYSPQQMASLLGQHPYAVKLAGEKARRFSEKALRAILAYLAEEDYRIKSGRIDKVLAVELFLMKMRDFLHQEG